MHDIRQFAPARVGYCRRQGKAEPVYDFWKCLRILERTESMPYADAYAFMLGLVRESEELAEAPVFVFLNEPM